MPTGNSVQASDNGSQSEPEPEGRGVSASQESEAAAGHPSSKPKSNTKASKLFVKRDGTFIRSSEVDLMPNEDLYRLRPRKFGQAAKYIKHTQAKG